MSEMITVTRIFAKLNDRFNPDNASGMNAVYQFSVSDAESFHLQICNQSLTASWGVHPDPDITLHLNEATLAGVVSGEIDGMSAFLKGQLRAEGNVMLATRLGKLFRH